MTMMMPRRRLSPPRLVALVKTPEGHFVKARHGEQIIRFPLELLHRPNNPHGLRDFLAKHYGLLIGKVSGVLKKEAINALPLIHGTTRLGWTLERDAFLYGADIFYTSKDPARRYEFTGSPLPTRGSWEEQFMGLAELWSRVRQARLFHCLSTVSPFLEPLGAPSLAFHLRGPSGIGKTTILRAAGIAPVADPGSPLFVADLSQDTDNYVDSRLGTVHNFPILLDETTLRDPKAMADAAYRIATGRTKGRLTGPEQGYAPAPTTSYALVCFLSGEDSIREGMMKRGAAARFIELPMEEPLLPRDELPAWWTFAEEHYGWYGRLLISWGIAHFFTRGRDGEPLREMYAGARESVASWCSGHSRLLDFLAAVHVGYVLAAHVLHIGLVGAVTRDKKERIAGEAEAFSHEVSLWLDPRTKIDDVLDAIAALPRIGEWITKGFIPPTSLTGVAEEFDLEKPKGALLNFLRHHGVVGKSESRTFSYWEGESPRSQRAYILTPEGRRFLEGRRGTTG
jgi:hypothetical protein